MPETLYRRLGGAERIAAIIEDALDRHAVNPVLAARLRGKDLPRLKQLGVQFFCAGLNISEQELLATVDDIVAALSAQGVAQAEVNEVVAMLHALRGKAALAPIQR